MMMSVRRVVDYWICKCFFIKTREIFIFLFPSQRKESQAIDEIASCKCFEKKNAISLSCLWVGSASESVRHKCVIVTQMDFYFS
jgi:hypothetical protein